MVHLSHHPRRECWVGWPTVKAITGEKVIPGALDHYLASFGWEGQMTGKPMPADRPGNLFKSVPGPYSAHGEFDRRARPESMESWADRHRGFLLTLAAGAAAGAWRLFFRNGRRHDGERNR